MSPATDRSYTAPPPDFTRYKLLEIERARQFDVPLPVAIECVRNIRREALASFWEACHVAKQNVTKPDHIWFLGFIEDLVRAFDSAMETDKNSYGGT